jgi:ABC-type nitrate/sulfonate/bicarbonate transport system substrate-binding protein
MRGTYITGNVCLITALALSGLSCGSDDQGPNEIPMVLAKSPVKSGDLQTGPVGQPLGNKLQVYVTKEGIAQEGVSITWFTNSGSLSPSRVQTNAEGLSASTWTLGDTPGTQAATASLPGATGSPLTFTATATSGTEPPPNPPGNLR